MDDDDMPETPDDFVEKYIFPLTNSHPDFDLVDDAFGTERGNAVLDIRLTDGSEWQVQIARVTSREKRALRIPEPESD